MTPTLMGRLQTRAFVIIVVGSLWTLALTPLLPLSGSYASRYQATFTVLGVVLVLGFLWDPLYQALQQYRWEKDWPALFGLLTGVNEGVAVWFLLESGWVPGHPHVTGWPFLLHFTTVWLITWAFANGAMRVPFPRWRFQGGRIL
jgi:hypothetical protein